MEKHEYTYFRDGDNYYYRIREFENKKIVREVTISEHYMEGLAYKQLDLNKEWGYALDTLYLFIKNDKTNKNVGIELEIDRSHKEYTKEKEVVKEYDGYTNNIVNVIDNSPKDLIICEIFTTLRDSDVEDNIKKWCMEKINKFVGVGE